MSTDTPEGDRIAKVLSRAGVASRRDAERMITEGRVKVNGKPVTSPALNVVPTDRLTVDGKPVDAPEPTRLWLYHKPAGLVTSESDEMGRATVFEQMPEGMPRVMSVGRLDITSEGLLILTNDGEIKRKLELPATGWLRRYRVRINGSVSEDKLDELRKGITVEGVDYQPMEVSFDRQQGANAWLTIAIREGKNREIRRVMEALGVAVNRLIRVSYGPFQLGDIPVGAVQELPRRQVRDQLGLDDPEDKPRGKPVRARKVDGDRARSAGPVMRSTKGTRPGEDAPRPARTYDKPRVADGDRPARTYDKPRAEGDRPARTYDKPRAEGDRPARTYDKPRAEGDRPARTYDKPRAEGDRPARTYDKPRAADGDRPARSYDRPRPEADGDRPARPYGKPSPKPYGPRAADGDRPYKPRPVADGDRPARPYGKPRDAADGDRPRPPYKPRVENADRPARAYAGKPGGKPYGPRAADAGDRPARTYDKPRAEGDRPARSFGAKSHGPRSSGPGAEGDRPARTFKPRPVEGDRAAPKSYGPRDAAGDGPRPARSFAKPRPAEGAKPYAPRSDGDRGPKSFGTKSHAPRTYGAAGAEGDAPRKPYAPRGDGPRKPYTPRDGGPPRAGGAPRPPRKGPGGGKNRPE